MFAQLSGLSLLIVLASAKIANAACLKEADIQRHNADVKSHSESVGRPDGNIASIYRQLGSTNFVEVVRQNRCIKRVTVLSADKVDQKYDLMATLWDERAVAQEEALDNEGMVDEENEAGEIGAIAESQSAPRDRQEVPNVSPNVRSTEYDNINVAALLELYEAYDAIRACFKARENQSPTYLSQQEMAKAEASFLRDEAEILSRDPTIDKKALSRKAQETNALFTMAVVLTGKTNMNYEHWRACQKLVSIFPPGIENARLKKREVIGKRNTGGGLVVPQDPRFR